eukprot:CAMPEP_0184668262 /NCGR_PEP_ID=MMETSP0308-20130426/71633_1 /TAXON_ID=38269 /ORGANISM="Gloeochaete witrockiana, Strain SAG 46.84" /LENGTH=557 /DNA_ID=CAMNT_0027113893 /DNA_START=45 /DNA_END=1715 /DNA_ORIENTATION=+
MGTGLREKRKVQSYGCIFMLILVAFGAVLLNVSSLSGVRERFTGTTMNLLQNPSGSMPFRYAVPHDTAVALTTPPEFIALDAILRERSRSNTVAFSMTNLRMMDFTLNYVQFAKKNNMDLFFLLALDQDSHTYMQDRGIPSFVANWGRTIYNSEGKRCGGLKAKYTLEILKKGYHVIMNDVDIVYLSDVLPHLSKDHDISASVDSFAPEAAPTGSHSNLGFVYIRSTPRSIRFIGQWLDHMVFFNSDIWDQRLFFEMVVQEAIWTYRDQTGTYNPHLSIPDKDRLRICYLDPMIFTHGGAYVTERTPQRAGVVPVEVHYGAHTCGPANKRFRAREWGLWTADDTSYYNKKLIRYTSLATPQNYTWEQEKAQLRVAFAVAKSLNRAVILPRLPCRMQPAYHTWFVNEEFRNPKRYSNAALTDDLLKEMEWCTFDHFTGLKGLAGRGYAEYYRESNVLSKPGVSSSNAKSITNVVLAPPNTPNNEKSAAKVVTPPNKEAQFTDVSIREALKQYEDRYVLDFGIFNPALWQGFTDQSENRKFEQDMHGLLQLTTAGRPHW